MALHVQLVSPERTVYEGEATLVVARTSDGEIGFQTGHVPFVGTLLASVVRLSLVDGGEQRIAVHSGFIEIADDHLTLLCDIAELAEHIDSARARDALARAEATMAADAGDVEATAAMRRAKARLRAVGADA